MKRPRLHLLAALCGGLLMALEILASRIIAPYFGNSVYIWGSIISVFLAALSLGYSWGGQIADRYPDLKVLGRLILAADGNVASAYAHCATAAFLVQPDIRRALVIGMGGGLATSISDSYGRSPRKTASGLGPEIGQGSADRLDLFVRQLGEHG